MSTVFFTPSQSRHLYSNKRRKSTALSIPKAVNEGGIAEHTRPCFRWIVLLVVCFAMFVYSYCYDNPVALQAQLQSNYALSSVQYNLLYSAYTFPNMILPFFSGILSDIFSADLMIIIFFLFIVCGQLTFIAGCMIHDGLYPVMFAGRFLFGIGAESFSLVVTPLIYEYFKTKELSFALGLLLSTSRLGSSANDYLTFYIYSKTSSIIYALGAGFVLLIIGLMAIILLLLQRCSVKYAMRKTQRSILHGSSSNHTHKPGGYDALRQHSVVTINSPGTGTVTASDVAGHHPLPHSFDVAQNYEAEQQQQRKGEKASAVRYHFSAGDTEQLRSHESTDSKDRTPQHRSWSNSAQQRSFPAMEDLLLTARAQTEDLNLARKSQIIDRDENLNADGNEKFSLRDLKQFDSVFWCLVINCALIYGVVLSFMNIGSDYLQTHYGYSHGKGNTLLMVPYVVGSILTPILGYISDKIGARGYMLLVSTLLLTATYYIFTWASTSSPYFAIGALIGLGISYSVFCAVIWPSFALVVPERLIGTGYGIPCVAYNGVLSLFYVMVGVLTSTGSPDGKNYYENVEIFLFSFSIFSTFTVVLLIIADKRTGGRLSTPHIT